MGRTADGHELVGDRDEVREKLLRLAHGTGSADGSCLLFGAVGSEAEKALRRSTLDQLEGVQLARLPYAGDQEWEVQHAMERGGCGCGLRVVASQEGGWEVVEYGECEALPCTNQREVRAEAQQPRRKATRRKSGQDLDGQDRFTIWGELRPGVGWEWIDLGIGLTGELWLAPPVAFGLRLWSGLGASFKRYSHSWYGFSGAHFKFVSWSGNTRPYLRLGLGSLAWQQGSAHTGDDYWQEYRSLSPSIGGGITFYLGSALRVQGGLELSTFKKPEERHTNLTGCAAVGAGF